MRTGLVGRQRELAELTECLDAAVGGQAGLVLCRGEPGVGKTRLAEELASTAVARRGVVGWGRAVQAAGAPPYWPWRQALRDLAALVDLPALAAERELAADLGRLAPELFGTPGDDPTADAPDVTRFRTFDAVAQLLGRVAGRCPLLVVLDDAQWADASTLLLLQHVARTMAGQRLLVVVLHRDTGPLPDVVAELRREPPTRDVVLRGLAAPDVGAQLTALLGTRPADAEVRRVHARTGGNPFYVREVARLLADPDVGDADRQVPDGVCAAVAARVARLPSPAGRVLHAASVVGREFDGAVVAEVLGLPVLDCLPALDIAAAAGLVEPGPVPGQHRFVHDIVRDAVEAGLGSAERVGLHRRAAEVVERQCAGGTDRRLADLARHWAVAAVAGERLRAVAWIRRAADDAVDRVAHEDAARLYRLALAVGGAELDDALRCRLLLATGAALKLAGNLSERLAVSRDAVRLARRLGGPDLLAEAALLVEGGECDPGPDVPLRRWCEDALAAMDPGSSALRAMVLANLADECTYQGDADAARTASARALTAAESCGDPAALAAALRARQLVAAAPEGVGERARLADRMDALGRDTRRAGYRMWAHLWRIDVAFQRGDLGAVGAELELLARATEEDRSPAARWHLLQCRAVLAQAQGRFADARRLADAALEGLPRWATGYESAVINRTGVLSAIGLHTGDAEEGTGPAFAAPGDGRPLDLDVPTEGVIFAAAAAYSLATGGQPAAARTVYRRLGAPATWRPIPHATTVCYAFGIGTAIVLDAREDVRVLRARLAPYRGQHVVSGAGAVAYDGPVELYLGAAARHLGDLDDAVADLESAVRACRANGAAGFAVHAACELAEALGRRARPGDAARARALAGDAAREAAALRMQPWADRARRLADAAGSGGRELTPREREVARLVAQGLTNRQIAARLHLSERTAQNHVQHILTKLDLANRSQLAVRTVREETGAAR